MLNISKDEKRYSEIELDLHKKLAYEKDRASIIEELEKLKTEIDNIRDVEVTDGTVYVSSDDVNEIINKKISKLKGEQMKYKEAIKKIPEGCDVSIGCSKGAGWFYFTKSEVLEIETEIIFQIMDKKMKASLRQLRWNIPTLENRMREEKYIKFVSCTGYIRDWNKLESMKERLPKVWTEYSEFNIIELLNCECVVRKKMDGSYGIILKKWNVSGNYWTKEEWEGENGAI